MGELAAGFWFLAPPELTRSDASFALKMIKRAPSLGLTVAEISWAGGEAFGDVEGGGRGWGQGVVYSHMSL